MVSIMNGGLVPVWNGSLDTIVVSHYNNTPNEDPFLDPRPPAFHRVMSRQIITSFISDVTTHPSCHSGLDPYLIFLQGYHPMPLSFPKTLGHTLWHYFKSLDSIHRPPL